MARLVTRGYTMRIMSAIMTPKESSMPTLKRRTVTLCTARIAKTFFDFAHIAPKTTILHIVHL